MCSSASTLLVFKGSNGGVAEPTAAAEMLHTDDYLRLHPSGALVLQRRDRGPGRREPFKALPQRVGLRTAHREESSSHIAETLIVLAGEQGYRRTASTIEFGAKNDEPTLGPALHLAPTIGAAAPIGASEPF